MIAQQRIYALNFSSLYVREILLDGLSENVHGRDIGQDSISDRVMRPALSEQCLVRGAGNLVPLAAAPERKRVTLDSCPVARPS